MEVINNNNGYKGEMVMKIECEICRNQFNDYIQCSCFKEKMIAEKKEQFARPPMPQRELPYPQRELPYPPFFTKYFEKNDETIKALKYEIDVLKEIVSQLIGGLYNPDTQPYHRKLHLDVLYQRPQLLAGQELHEEIRNTMNENPWPTTRQGDENEKRIQDLERFCKSIV